MHVGFVARGEWRALVAGAFGASAYMIVYLPGAIATRLGQGVGAVAAVDVALGVGSLGFLLGSLVVGRGRGTLRRVPPLLCVLGAAGLLLAAATRSPAVLVGGLAIANVGGAATFAAQVHILRVSSDRGPANGTYIAVATAGLAVSQWAGPRIAEAWGAGWALVLPVPLLLGSAVLLRRWSAPAEVAPAREPSTRRTPAMWATVACMVVLFVASWQHNPWLNGLERAFRDAGLPVSRAGDVLAFATLAGAVVAWAISRLRCVRVGLALGAVAAATAYFVPGLAGGGADWLAALLATVLLRAGTVTIYDRAPMVALTNGNASRLVGGGNVAKALGGAGSNLALAGIGTIEARLLDGRVASVCLLVAAALAVATALPRRQG